MTEAGQGITLGLVPCLSFPAFGTYIYLGLSWPHLRLRVVGRSGLKLSGSYHISMLPVDQAVDQDLFLSLAVSGLCLLEPFTDFGYHLLILVKHMSTKFAIITYF